MAVIISDMQGTGHESKHTRPKSAAAAWPSAASVVGALAAVCAAWTSAGSIGLLGLPLRHVLAWVLLGVTIILCRPSEGSATLRVLRILLAVLVVAVMSASSLMPVNVLAAGLVLAILAGGREQPDNRVLTAMAAACAVFGVYRLAVTSSSWLWLSMNAVGGALGYLGTHITGRTLNLGASFAGTDFLVLAFAVWAACLAAAVGRRWTVALAGLAGIVLAEIAWLAVLAQAFRLSGVVDPAVLQQTWSWQGMLAAAVPWNLPVLALPIFLPVVAWLLRSLRMPLPALPSAAREQPAPAGSPGRFALVRTITSGVAVFVLAAALPILTTLSWGLGPLQGAQDRRQRQRLRQLDATGARPVWPAVDRYVRHAAPIHPGPRRRVPCQRTSQRAGPGSAPAPFSLSIRTNLGRMARSGASSTSPVPAAPS